MTLNKSISTEYGQVETNADITHTDNGQVVIHLTSKLGEAKHEHNVTVGAENGKDSVARLSETDLQAAIQKHLDDKRNEAAQVLAGRAKVSKISVNLQ